jgi:hypothetical protein
MSLTPRALLHVWWLVMVFTRHPYPVCFFFSILFVFDARAPCFFICAQ